MDQDAEDDSFITGFGPRRLAGVREIVVQAMPVLSFDAMLRLCGPPELWIEKTWRPGDLELLGQISDTLGLVKVPV